MLKAPCARSRIACGHPAPNMPTSHVPCSTQAHARPSADQLLKHVSTYTTHRRWSMQLNPASPSTFITTQGRVNSYYPHLPVGARHSPLVAPARLKRQHVHVTTQHRAAVRVRYKLLLVGLAQRLLRESQASQQTMMEPRTTCSMRSTGKLYDLPVAGAEDASHLTGLCAPAVQEVRSQCCTILSDKTQFFT